jgi:hypothetical protein
VPTPKDLLPELKTILKDCVAPAQLDDHPWTESLFVRRFVGENPAMETKSPGYQLLAALSDLFRAKMPAAAPRQGKRIDSQWGEFGILAALYFAPFQFATVRPDTLLDAWGRIDEVVALFVFGQDQEDVSADEIERYRLIADEEQAAPTSTLSDWHVRGLERLAKALLARERLLSAEIDCPSVVLDPKGASESNQNVEEPAIIGLLHQIRAKYHRHKRWLWSGLALIIVLFLGWKTWRIATLAQAFRADVAQLESMVDADLSLDTAESVGPLLDQTRRDVQALQRQARPFLWAGRLFGWVPVYGGDFAAAGNLLDLAEGLVLAGDLAFDAADPLLEAVQGDQRPPLSTILETLVTAESQFAEADVYLTQALAAREAIDIDALSPKTQPYLEKIDPYLPLLADGIPALEAIPSVLGAEPYGPQTYLVLIQNEDELRATGGFITAVATVTVENGDIIAFKAQDSYDVDEYSKLYPQPPWQLEAYMDAPIWVFRDSNWSPDFPTAATWAEHLYAYSSAHAVDGVVAIDQEVIRLLLSAVGSIQIDGASEPIGADNVIAFMRQERGQSQEERQNDEDWFEQRKDFIRPLAQALLDKLQHDDDVSMRAVGEAMFQALEERHLLLQIDDAAIARLLKQRGWDGSMRFGERDYLMVVDSNLGFNKVNAVAQTKIQYSIDLSDIQETTARLDVIHRNPVAGEEPNPNEITVGQYLDRLAFPLFEDQTTICRHAPYDTGNYQDLIERCYWNYLRVYVTEGATLLDASPEAIPGEWMHLGDPVPARVDVLDNDGAIDQKPLGLNAFGTMVVVPRGEQRVTQFQFALPSEVLSEIEPGVWEYQLVVQKQPGTLAVPLHLQIKLPPRAELISANPSGEQDENTWRAVLNLRTDLELVLRFQMP